MPERDGYIPMPEANTSRLRTSVALPFGLEKQIGLNVNLIHIMLQLGGISSLKICSNNEGRMSNVSFEIASLNQDGSAMAGRSLTDTIPTSSFGLNPGKRVFPIDEYKQCTWPSLNLELNIPEIKQRMLGRGEKVTEPKNWKSEVDKAIRLAVRKSGTKNLLSIGSNLDKLLFGILYLKDVGLAIKINSAQINVDPLDLANRFITTGILFTIFYSMLNGLEEPGMGRRISLFYGFEPDRALALQIVSITKPVAKTLPY